MIMGILGRGENICGNKNLLAKRGTLKRIKPARKERKRFGEIT